VVNPYDAPTVSSQLRVLPGGPKDRSGDPHVVPERLPCRRWTRPIGAAACMQAQSRQIAWAPATDEGDPRRCSRARTARATPERSSRCRSDWTAVSRSALPTGRDRHPGRSASCSRASSAQDGPGSIRLVLVEGRPSENEAPRARQSRDATGMGTGQEDRPAARHRPAMVRRAIRSRARSHGSGKTLAPPGREGTRHRLCHAQAHPRCSHGDGATDRIARHLSLTFSLDFDIGSFAHLGATPYPFDRHRRSVDSLTPRYRAAAGTPHSRTAVPARNRPSRRRRRPMCLPSRRIRAIPSRTPPRRQVGHSCSALDNIGRFKESDTARRPHEARRLAFEVDQR